MKLLRSNIILFFLVVISHASGIAQEPDKVFQGIVTYITTQNVYVKFKSTENLAAGDTLYIRKNAVLTPVLVVKELSSTSCLCTPIEARKFVISEQISAIIRPHATRNEGISQTTSPQKPSEIQKDTAAIDTTIKKSPANGKKQVVYGNISLNSYLDNSNTGMPNTAGFRYTFSLDARNIGNSKLSFNTYVSFRHKSGEFQEVKDDLFSALKIYSLSANYDLNKTTRINIGRKINPFISHIGASDGIQAEKSINRFTLGVLAGSRPDYVNYGFNSRLFQYGAYVVHKARSSASPAESSLAFMQQMNDWKTDRRFLYFQHSNSLIKNIYFFGTVEADLYKLKLDTSGNETAQNIFSLTGLYFSLNYRIGGKFNLSASYDARKNVVYYETYKTFIDRILEDEMRQGFRVHGNYRISSYLMAGFMTGYRFLKSDPHPSKNIYAYFSYNRIPVLNINATLSTTILESAYVKGNINGFRLTRDFLGGKIQSGLAYRYFDSKLPESNTKIRQNIAEGSLALQLTSKILFTFNYEGTFELSNSYNRVYLQLRKRF